MSEKSYKFRKTIKMFRSTNYKYGKININYNNDDNGKI